MVDGESVIVLQKNVGNLTTVVWVWILDGLGERIKDYLSPFGS